MEIEDLLKHCIERGASDLHIIPGLPPVLRINGDLITSQDFEAIHPELASELIYSIMNVDEQVVFESKLCTELSISQPDLGYFRVSAFHHNGGVAAALRVIPSIIPSMTDLGLPPVLKALLSLSHGLIVVSGPTGSGKSTTLAAMIDYINATRAAHIITIEDPIEYLHTNKRSAINQIQVGRDTPSVDAALHASLRQDPDILLVGEMRDLETIRLALTAAETGHLVLTTLHASSAPLSISRIVDIFPTGEKNRIRNLLSETLQAVLCQMLVKKTNEGRTAAFEVMLATAPIRHLIRQDMVSHMETTIQTNTDIGMCTMEQSVQKLLTNGVITHATARGIYTKRGAFNE